MASRKSITQLIKKIVSVTIIGIVAFGSLMVIPLGRASAGQVSSGGGSAPVAAPNVTLIPLDKFSPEKQAQIWSLIGAATYIENVGNIGHGDQGNHTACDVGRPHNGNLTADDIAGGNWLWGGSKARAGNHVSPDGTVDCADAWFRDLLNNDAGFAGDLTSRGLKVFQHVGNNANDPLFELKNNSQDSARSALRGILADAFFGSGTGLGSARLPTFAPDHIAYQILIENFVNPTACDAHISAGLQPDAKAILHASHDRTAHIWVFNPTTHSIDKVEYYYIGKDVSVGYGLNVSGAADGILTCDSIAAQLQNAKYTAAVLKYTTDHPKTPPSTTNTVGGATTPDPSTHSTCQTGGFGLNWILCPIFNIVGGFADWLFSALVQPLLMTTPVSTNANDPSFKIWSNFRIYGDIFLVIALLVVVFGQSLGGGLIDAYTAKKVLPRLLAAAIMINLSIYIVALLVDLTNIIGGGLGSLITAPLSNAGAFNISAAGITPGHIQVGTALLEGAAGVGIVTAWSTGILASMISLDAAAFIGIFVLIPAALGLLAAVVTLVFRQAIILGLVLISPVAFALYCLPNTEKYFQQWWGLLIKTLAVYPIVVAIFAISDVLSVTLARSSAGSATAPLALILSFLLQFIPLLMIPFAFKLAGGAIGNIHGLLGGYSKRTHEGIKGNVNDPTSRQNRARYNMKSALNASRERKYGTYANAAKSDSRVKRWGATRMARLTGVGNLQGERAKYNDEQDKIIGAQYSVGNDDTVRALWATQSASGRWHSPYAGPGATHATLADAETAYGAATTDQGRAAAFTGFKEVSQADVSKARQLVGGDTSRFQAYAKYELGKTANDGEVAAFKSKFIERSNAAGYTGGEANGIWAGVKFSHQNTRKEQKYTNIEGDKDNLSWGGINHGGLSNELVDTMRKGDYSGFRQSTAAAARAGFRETSAHLNTADYYTSEANYTNAADHAAGRNQIHTQANDQVANQNYRALGEHLRSSFAGQSLPPGMAEAANQAEGDGRTIPGYGLGASQRAETEWKKFVQETTAPPTP